MPFQNMDALFHVAAQGSRNAFEELRIEFIRKGNIILSKEAGKCSNYPEMKNDLNDYFDELFLKSLVDYENTRGSFSWFTKVFLEYKINSKLNSLIKSNELQKYSLDDISEGGTSYIELLKDEDSPSIQSEIAMKNFRYTIASPRRTTSRMPSVKNKVLLMKYGGFSDAEIIRKLKITPGLLRQIIKEYNEDEILSNLKLELK